MFLNLLELEFGRERQSNDALYTLIYKNLHWLHFYSYCKSYCIFSSWLPFKPNILLFFCYTFDFQVILNYLLQYSGCLFINHKRWALKLGGIDLIVFKIVLLPSFKSISCVSTIESNPIADLYSEAATLASIKDLPRLISLSKLGYLLRHVFNVVTDTLRACASCVLVKPNKHSW